MYRPYLVKCSCGKTTSKIYAASHHGECKSCTMFNRCLPPKDLILNDADREKHEQKN